MTSSLVGSEMCIRDSTHSVSGSLRRARNNALHAAEYPVKKEMATKDKIPVSYTHLTLPTICSV
eukprot:4179725-Prorocentrum_lima.AAC.1